MKKFFGEYWRIKGALEKTIFIIFIGNNVIMIVFSLIWLQRNQVEEVLGGTSRWNEERQWQINRLACVTFRSKRNRMFMKAYDGPARTILVRLWSSPLWSQCPGWHDYIFLLSISHSAINSNRTIHQIHL